jgi:hypothetical protein
MREATAGGGTRGYTKAQRKPGARPPTGLKAKSGPQTPTIEQDAPGDLPSLLAASFLVEDHSKGDWLQVAKDFGGMSEAARDLAFECRACQDGSITWCPSDDLQRTFQSALRQLQEGKHVIPNAIGPRNDLNGVDSDQDCENATPDEASTPQPEQDGPVETSDRDHLEALLQLKCPQIFDRTWGIPPQSVLENGAIACRRVAVEARRLHDAAVAARGGQRGTIPRVGLHKLIAFYDGMNVGPAQIVRELSVYYPRQSEKQIRELVKRTRRTVRGKKR